MSEIKNIQSEPSKSGASIGIGDLAFNLVSSVVVARILTRSFTSSKFWAYACIGQTVGLATGIWVKRLLDKGHREGKHDGFPTRE